MTGNWNMNRLIAEAQEADKLSAEMHNAAHKAAERAGELHSNIVGLRSELKRIEAKRLLKLRLTARERAIWTLYGKETKGGTV